MSVTHISVSTVYFCDKAGFFADRRACLSQTWQSRLGLLCISVSLSHTCMSVCFVYCVFLWHCSYWCAGIDGSMFTQYVYIFLWHCSYDVPSIDGYMFTQYVYIPMAICLHTNGNACMHQCLYTPMTVHLHTNACTAAIDVCSHWCDQTQPLVCLKVSVCVCVRYCRVCLSVSISVALQALVCTATVIGIKRHWYIQSLSYGIVIWFHKALVHTVIVIWHCDMVP